MRRLVMPLAAGAALALTSIAVGQEPAPPPQQPAPPAEQPAPDTPPEGAAVSDEDLETFADIYVDLEATLNKFEEELAAVETEQEAQDVQVRMQQESFDKIAERGWTPEKYNMVVQAVNADPQLLQRALELIEERS